MSWPSTGPMYLRPRSSNIPCGATMSLMPFFMPCKRVVDRAAHHRCATEQVLAPLEEPLVAAGRAQRREVVGETADGRRVGPFVVVDDDDQPARLVGRDVVERLPGHAARQRTVTDHGDHVAVGQTAQLVGLGDAVGIGQRRRRVGVLDDVVVGLGLARIAREPALALQAREVADAAGDHLVHVGLVAGVPDEPVARRVEDPVQGEGQLDDTEVRSEVASGARDRGDEEGADLLGQRGQLVVTEATKVARTPDRLEESHSCAPNVG